MKKLYHKNKELVRDSIWRAIQIGTKHGIVFFFTILSAKILNVEQFGEFTYYFTFILLLTMLSDFGISSAISKFVAEYNYKKRNKINSVTGSSFFILIILSILITILSIFYGKIFFNNLKLFYILLPLVFLVPAVSIFDGIFRGLQKFKILANISIFSALFSIVPFYWLIKFKGVEGLALGYIVFYSVMGLFNAIAYLKINRKEFGKFKVDLPITKNVLRYSYYLGLASLSYFMFSRFTIILLGHFGFVEELAYYEIISKFESIFLVPFFIIGHVLAPSITRLYQKNKLSEFYNKLKGTRNYTILGSILFAILFAGIVWAVVYFFFEEYSSISFNSILLICFFLFIIKSYAIVIDFGFIVSSGYGHLMTYRYLTVAFVNVILSLFLNLYFGYLGIFLTMVISHILMVVSLHFKFFKLIKNLKEQINKSS